MDTVQTHYKESSNNVEPCPIYEILALKTSIILDLIIDKKFTGWKCFLESEILLPNKKGVPEVSHRISFKCSRFFSDESKA